jgi:DNA-directed RNA polymerase specialized sigma24 family protein
MKPSTAVADALEELPQLYREALLLVRNGVRYDEVAELLEVPVEKVRSAVLHGMMALTQARLTAAGVAQT